MSKYAALARQAFISSLKKDNEKNENSEDKDNSKEKENTNIQFINNPNDSVDKQSWNYV
jgi:hypothetical protein